MRAPTGWIAELVGLDEVPAGADVAADLVRVGLEEEDLHGGDVTGPIVVGRVESMTDEPQKNGKTIHFCTVDVGDHGQRADAGGDPSVLQEIVCGAHNFQVGDLVVVVLPGATLPGGFTIGARKTYGHMSHGMICAEDELGLGGDHDGIIVLTRYLADDPERLARCVPGADAMDILGIGEEVPEINVTPDRGYCFSMRGVAREYALSTGRPEAFRDPVSPSAVTPAAANDGGYPVHLVDDAPVHGRAGCDRYVARVVRGIDPAAATPAWMSRRLTQMGMRPISLTVDVTNYLMLLTGQPLHAFDLAELSGAIEVRRARPGEKLTTLDGVERALSAQDLLITDDGATPLALAGVMGGADCEVSAATTDVLVESAHFDPVTVARSSRRHKLATEASKRFERGVDPEMTAAVAQLAVDLLVELAGGTPDAGVTDVDVREPLPSFRFDTAQAWRLVEPSPTGDVPEGLDHDSVVAVLRAIGCDVEDVDLPENGFAQVGVTPPPWRPDLLTGPDLVEEVARVRGYDRIPSVLPQAPSGRGLTRGQQLVRRTGAVLAGMGFTEVWSYPFVGAEVFDRLGYDEDDDRRRALRIANPLADTAPLMRTSLLDTLLGTARVNAGRGLRDLALFETGLVVGPLEGETGRAPVPAVGVRPDDAVLDEIDAALPPQPRHVAFVLTGDATSAGPWGRGRAVDATDAIGAALALSASLGVNLTVRAATRAPWHPGRCASLSLPDGTVVGHAGELHPKVCPAFELPARTCAAELDLDAIVAAGGDVVQVETLSTLPVAHTDVALVVDAEVPAAQVERALREGAGGLLEELRLFDVYRGEQVGEGKKSLAYRLTFRPREKTLTTPQVSELRDAAVASAAEATGAVLRGTDD